MTWQPSRKTQRQRKAERDRLDRADSIAAADRANDRCEVCGEWSGYDANSEFSGSMHHAHGKGSAILRHDRRYHIWCCNHCHSLAHASNDEGTRAKISAIISKTST
jgi:hypothetical protein